MILEAVNLFVKHRHGVLAVNNLSFHVDKGELLTVLGDAESGKTSLLKAIAGLYRITGGELILYGKKIGEIPLSDREVRLCHEDGGFFRFRSAKYNLLYPLKFRKSDFSPFPLSFFPENRLKTKVYKLTAEEKIALMMERLCLPFGRIFLLDDPFKGLPEERRKEIFSFYLPFIRSLTERGAVIYATTSRSEAEILDAPTLLIHYGVEQQFGPISDFSAAPNSLCALYYSSVGYEEGLVLLEEADGRPFVSIDGEKHFLQREFLLNDVYVGKEVIYAKTEKGFLLFDRKCERRIYFPDNK